MSKPNVCGLLEEQEPIPPGYRVIGHIATFTPDRDGNMETSKRLAVAEDFMFVPERENPNLPEDFKIRIEELHPGTDGILFVQYGAAKESDLMKLKIKRGVNLTLCWVYDITKIRVAWKPKDASPDRDTTLEEIAKDLEQQEFVNGASYASYLRALKRPKEAENEKTEANP